MKLSDAIYNDYASNGLSHILLPLQRLSAGFLRPVILIMHVVVLGSVVALLSLCSARPAQNDILDSNGRTQGFSAEYLPSPLRNA